MDDETPMEDRIRINTRLMREYGEEMQADLTRHREQLRAQQRDSGEEVEGPQRPERLVAIDELPSELESDEEGEEAAKTMEEPAPR